MTEQIIDLVIAIFSSLIIVPIIFLITNYLEFNQYLRLLTKEIKNNLDLIENLPKNLEDVRNKKRQWLPGIGSNKPREGYVYRYLSMNVYNNLTNQKYWIYLNSGAVDRLSEIYEGFDIFCNRIQYLQTKEDNGEPIKRDDDQFVKSNVEYLYSENRFFSHNIFRDNHKLFSKYPDDSYYTNLEKTKKMTKEQSGILLKSNDINTFKDPRWWYPNWLKYLLSE
jgi:hypothetical protein